MGATPRQLRRIQEAYNERGMDTFTFSAGPLDVLFPKQAIALMEVPPPVHSDSVLDYSSGDLIAFLSPSRAGEHGRCDQGTAE
jgi:hypothetical protein